MVVKSCTKGKTYIVDLISKSGYSIRNAMIASRYGREILVSQNAGNEVFHKLRLQFIHRNNQRFLNNSYQAMSEFTGQCLNIRSPDEFHVIKVKVFCYSCYCIYNQFSSFTGRKQRSSNYFNE